MGGLDENTRFGGNFFHQTKRLCSFKGFKTGHVYRKPALKFRMEQSSSVSSVYLSEIATPPMSISRGRSVEAYSADTMSKSEKLRKQLERVNWLNSPNNYMKIHVLDCNSDNPRTVTKVCFKRLSP